MTTSRKGAGAPGSGASGSEGRGGDPRAPDKYAPGHGAARLELSSWLGRQLVLGIGLLVAATMFAISGVMNFRFGMTLGSGPIDPLLYGVASVTADGFKALLPFIAIGLWRARKPLLTFAALGLWLLCVAWSLASAMGFATSTRDQTIATREAVNEQRAGLAQRVKRLEGRIALLPAHRPAGVVSAAIANADVPRAVWNRTRQCTDVTIPESLRLCQPVLDLRKELAIAQDAEKLERQLQETRAALGGVVVLGEKKDPQAETLAGLLGFSADQIRSGLAVLITLLIEAGSALGFTLVAIGAGQLRVRRLPQKIVMSAEDRRRLAAALAEGELAALDLQNARRKAAIADEQVKIEAQLNASLKKIESIRQDRPRLSEQQTRLGLPAPEKEAQAPEPEPDAAAPRSATADADFNQDFEGWSPEDENQDLREETQHRAAEQSGEPAPDQEDAGPEAGEGKNSKIVRIR